MKKHIDSLKISFCCIIIFFCISTPTFASTTPTQYQDVPKTHWANSSILKIQSLSIMKDIKGNLFYPNQSVTRAEIAQYVFNALNAEEIESFTLLYKDISSKQSYFEAVKMLTSRGVFQNTNYFYPNRTLTRAEFSKIIVKAFAIDIDRMNKTSFKDVSSKHWAIEDILTLADIGIINGKGNNRFSPNDPITRAEVAVIFDKLFHFQEQLASGDLVYDYLQKDYLSLKNPHANLANEVVLSVNKEREKVGVKPLQTDRKLTQLALIKAYDMVNQGYFEHQSPVYGYPWDLAGLFDYPFISIGENIARYYSTSAAVVTGWLGSPSHKSTLLNEKFTNTGVACVKAKNGQFYWVQLFSSN